LLPLYFRRCLLAGSIFITSQYILAGWDFRHFFWPRYGLKALWYHNLRVWMLRIIIQRIVFSLADCIVLQAPGLIDRLKVYAPVSGATMAWLPNNIMISQACRETMATARIIDPAIRLLYVGGLSVSKGADVLLDLIDRARSRSIPLKGIIVGGFAPIDKSYLLNRIHNLNLREYLTVHMRLRRERVNEFYNDCDWLFHMSNVDGSPRVVLEALSCGLPVIGSSHPGITVLDPDRQFILFGSSSQLDQILDELVASKKDPQRYASRSMRGSCMFTHTFPAKR
jgi:glycosyltransferase involved in cell wall biosynthesis